MACSKWNLERSSSPQGDHIARYVFAKGHLNRGLVLDAGCGAGYGIPTIADDCRAVVGVDISSEALAYSMAFHRRNNIDFAIQSVTNLGFRNEVFDAILSFEVIEHLRNHKAYLRELRRVLRNGGVLLLSTPNKRMMSPGRKKPVWKWHHVEFYAAELKSLLEEFFETVRMFGETTTNLHWRARDRRAIILHRYARLIPSELIRLVPAKVIEVLFWKVPPVSLEEIQISEIGLEEARTLIAVCEKRFATQLR